MIFFKETVYGKATHKRTEDPSMFELLAWDDEVMGKNSFKKNGKFNETSTAYVNMIGKRPWTS